MTGLYFLIKKPGHNSYRIRLCRVQHGAGGTDQTQELGVSPLVGREVTAWVNHLQGDQCIRKRLGKTVSETPSNTHTSDRFNRDSRRVRQGVTTFPEALLAGLLQKKEKQTEEPEGLI